MGVTVFPKGNALLSFGAPGVPTKSIMTLVVSQNAATGYDQCLAKI